MSLDGNGVSSAARRKIGRFSIVSWVYALAAMLVVTAVTTSMVRFDIEHGVLYVVQNFDDIYNPYELENPVEAAYDPDTQILQGNGAAVFHWEGTSLDDAPFRLEHIAGERVGIYQTPGGDAQSAFPANMRLRADYRGGVSEFSGGLLVFPEAGTTEIWVGARGAWRMKVSPLVAEEIVATASGKGNAWLVYRGDSLSGRAAQIGEGLFGVWAHTSGKTSDLLVNESGSSDTRVSWEPGRSVYFFVESDAARASWELRIDTLATEAPSDPTVDPSADPSAGPSAGPETSPPPSND